MVKKGRAASSGPSTPAVASPSKVSIGPDEADGDGTPRALYAARDHLTELNPSASATPAPAHEERNVMKAATLVPGSGDGTGHGDECFLWTDLPMNKNGGWEVNG